MTPTAASVDTTSSIVVARNTARRGLVLCNTSFNNISLAFGSNDAVLNSGVTLLGGASWAMNRYQFTTAEVRAIASAAGSNLAIQEFF